MKTPPGHALPSLILLVGCGTTLDLPRGGGHTGYQCQELEQPTTLDDGRFGLTLQGAIDDRTGLDWPATWLEDGSSTTMALTVAATGEPFLRTCDDVEQFVEVPASGSFSTGNGVFSDRQFSGEVVVYADGTSVFKAELLEPGELGIDWTKIYVIEGPGDIRTDWLRLEVYGDRAVLEASGNRETTNTSQGLYGTVLEAAPAASR